MAMIGPVPIATLYHIMMALTTPSPLPIWTGAPLTPPWLTLLYDTSMSVVALEDLQVLLASLLVDYHDQQLALNDGGYDLTTSLSLFVLIDSGLSWSIPKLSSPRSRDPREGEREKTPYDFPALTTCLSPTYLLPIYLSTSRCVNMSVCGSRRHGGAAHQAVKMLGCSVLMP